MSELTSTILQTLDQEGTLPSDTLPSVPPVVSPPPSKRQNRKQTTLVKPDAKPAKKGKAIPPKNDEKELAKQQKAELEAQKAKWANMKALSPTAIRGANNIAALDNITRLIVNGDIIIPGFDISSHKAKIAKELKELEVEAQKGTTMTRLLAIASRTNELNSLMENATSNIAQQWALNFIFTQYFHTDSPTPNSPTGNNNPVPTNSPLSGNMPKIVPVKQRANEWKEYLKSQGKPMGSTAYTIQNSILTQEQWSELGMVKDYFTSPGWQLFSRDGVGNYTYLTPMGLQDTGSKVCRKYREIVTGLETPPNDGIHTSAFETAWATNNGVNFSQLEEEFKQWAIRTIEAKKAKK